MTRKFLILLAVFFLLHIFLRVIVSTSLLQDESEMVLLFQQPFQLGYNSQPPLYTWIQMAFFYLFGLNIFSLTFLANLLLFLTYFFIYKTARLVMHNERYALFSALSLFLVYDFGWIAHKGLTHSVIMVLVCVLTLYVLLQLTRKKRARYYAALGCCVGLGMLAKYNYSIFIVAMVLALLATKPYRSVLLDKRILLSFMLAFVISAPHLLWAATHLSRLMQEKAQLNMAQGSFLLGFRGIKALLWEALLFLLSLLVIFGLLFREGFRRIRSIGKQQSQLQKLIELFFAIFLAICCALLLFFKVVDIQVRWLFPALVFAPLYFFLRLGEVNVSRVRQRIFVILLIIAAVANLGSLYGRVFFASHGSKYHRLNYPFADLTAMIQKTYFKKGLIVADNCNVGANLKIHFKDSFVVFPEGKLIFDIPQNLDEVLLVYTDETWPSVRLAMYAMAEKQGFLNLSQAPVVLSAPYLYSQKAYFKIYIVTGRKRHG